MKQNLAVPMVMDTAMVTVMEAIIQDMVITIKRKERQNLKSGIILVKRNVANYSST